MTSPTPPDRPGLARVTAAISQLAFWGGVIITAYMALTPLQHEAAGSISAGSQHLAAFAYLTITMWCAYRVRIPPARIVLILFGYGLGIELVQLSMAYRTFELIDLAADAVGIALGATCIILAIRVTPGASLYPTW
ncbi:MAG: VanZ family protein [Candidatus Binatia bacterium]